MPSAGGSVDQSITQSSWRLLRQPLFLCQSESVTGDFSQNKNQLSAWLAVTALTDSNSKVGLFDVLLVAQFVRGASHSNPAGFQ